jgi:hypothetical protein
LLRPTARHPTVFRATSGGPGSGPPVAKGLIRRSKDNPEQTDTPQEHTMIAATAFAVVGLVVIAFLNRIP